MLDALLSLFEYPRAGFNANHLELVLKVCHSVLRTRVIPDDSLAEGFAGAAAPGDGRFALVGDPCEFRCKLYN